MAACDLLEYMRTDGVERDTVVLNSVLNACAKAGETDMAMKILRDLQVWTSPTHAARACGALSRFVPADGGCFSNRY